MGLVRRLVRKVMPSLRWLRLLCQADGSYRMSLSLCFNYILAAELMDQPGIVPRYMKLRDYTELEAISIGILYLDADEDGSERVGDLRQNSNDHDESDDLNSRPGRFGWVLATLHNVAPSKLREASIFVSGLKSQ